MIRILVALFILSAGLVQAEVKIKTLTSPGGIAAWLVDEPTIPFTALEIMFSGGAALDPADKRGAAYLMMGLLEEGSGTMNAQAFAAAQEALAASFSFNVYDDTVVISIRFLTENREESLALLKMALTQPRFDSEAIERVRTQVLSILASNAQDPDSVASSTWAQIAFGDHPYGTPREGTLSSIAAITRDDIIAVRQMLFVRDNLFVSAVGDISEGELGPLLDDLLGDLPAGLSLKTAPVEFATKGGLTVVNLPTPQSVALFGHAGIDRDDPDFFAAYVLNTILGGRGVESRLSTEVREKRGLTYGVSSFLVGKEEANMLMGQVASANDRIGSAIEVIRNEWIKMAQHGVSQTELIDAQTYLTGAYPLRFDGNAKIANILVGMQRQGLSTDYINTRNDQINAVTLTQINRVAAELLQPEALHFVVVGQPKGLNEE
ncbi:MAG: pitrilysin family protein [Planktomarina sp.]|nr:pitrilysin family protein [Planktomarina sp.]